jgi:deazaflavin-dependent oxidoreductase (nitroreductase family)
MPIWLYQVRLGWLLGGRFLMLTHIGRKSGVPHQTVLEVVGYNSMTDTYIIASGWGVQADWFRNIQKTAHVLVDTGRRRLEAVAERLSEEDAERAIHDYAQRHPFAFRALAGAMIGRRLTGTEEDYRELARSIPLVALRPRAAIRHSKSRPG